MLDGDTPLTYINEGSILVDAVNRSNTDKQSASDWIDKIVSDCNAPSAPAN